MARITPIENSSATPQQRVALVWIEEHHGAATNMKRTLARSTASLHALLEWYPLQAEVKEFLGERGARLFAHAISSGDECVLCTSYFRRELVEAGEDPDNLLVEGLLAAVAEYGSVLATNPNGVSDELWERLAGSFSGEQLVVLTAFGTLMIATNVFNNALSVDLDDGLDAFLAPQSEGAQRG